MRLGQLQTAGDTRPFLTELQDAVPAQAKFQERVDMMQAKLLGEAPRVQKPFQKPFITELRPQEAGPGPYPDGDWTRIDPITGEFALPEGVLELLRLTGVMVSLDVINGFKLYYKHSSGNTYVCCYKIKATIEDWASACQHLMNHAEEAQPPTSSSHYMIQSPS